MPLFSSRQQTYLAVTSNTQPDYYTSFASSNNVTVVAQSPFSGGGNSYSFTGTNTSWGVVSASSYWAFGTGDFTIEWFQYETDSNAFPRPWWIGSTPMLGMSYEGNVYIWRNGGGSSMGAPSTVLGTYKNTWVHLAYVRSSNTYRFYRNGTQTVSAADTTNYSNTTSTFTIAARGTNGLASEAFGGYITNFRVTSGVAVYTGTFTTPNTALTATQSAGANIAAISAGSVKMLLVP